MTTALRDSGSRSLDRATIDARLEEVMARARAAYEQKDYAAAVRCLDQIPEPLRTAPMTSLLETCIPLRDADQQLVAARRCLENADYDMTMRNLERIPEALRSEEARAILLEAQQMGRLKPTLTAARRSLAANDYDEALRLLDAVPPALRNDDYNSLLDEAYAKRDAVAALLSQIDVTLKQAAAELSASLFDAALSLLEKVLQLQPGLHAARRQLQEARAFQQKIEHSEQVYQSALLKFEQRNYQETIALLVRVPAELRASRFQELLQKAEACHAELETLTGEALDAIDAEQYAALGPTLKQLQVLQPDCVQRLTARLTTHELDTFLTRLAQAARHAPELWGTLDDFIGGLTLAQFLQWCGVSGKAVLPSYPAELPSLPDKLAQILESLHRQPIDELERQLEIVRAAGPCLGQQAQRLADWDELLTALDTFVALQPKQVHWSSNLMQSGLTTRLEQIAEQVAIPARRVLPATNDGWRNLQQVANGRLTHSAPVITRIYRKMRGYLKTGRWSRRSITPITVQRIAWMIGSISGVTIVASMILILTSQFRGLGLWSSFVLTGVLSVLWTGFYHAVNRILSGSEDDDWDEAL